MSAPVGYPTNWYVGPLRHVTSFTTGWTPPTDNADSYDGDLPWANISDLGSKFLDHAAKHVSRDAAEAGGCTLAQPGDLLMSFKLSVGIISIARRPMYTNEAIATFRDSPRLLARYGYYVLPVFVPLNAAYNIYGAPLLNAALIRSAVIACPRTLGEQVAIADFLDRETAKIDALIAKQEQLAMALRERRASLIESAVVWPPNGKRLKHFVVEVRQGWSPQCEGAAADGVNEWGVLKTGCVNGGIFRPTENTLLPTDVAPRPDLTVSQGEIVISRASTKDLVGSAAVVEENYPRLMLSDKTYALHVDADQADARYITLVLGTPLLRELIEVDATGASYSMQNISCDDILNLPVSLPPLDRQRDIVQRLGTQTARLDALVVKARELITVMKERRSALVSAAVTGQLDVDS